MQEFLIELAVLLEKHNASIEWYCDDCTDTHGIYGDGMVVTADGVEHRFPNTWDIDGREVREAYLNWEG
jgi:hypothetical protein